MSGSLPVLHDLAGEWRGQSVVCWDAMGKCVREVFKWAADG